MKVIINLLRIFNKKQLFNKKQKNKRFYSNSYKLNMKIIIVPLNDDNYGYILIDNVTNEAAIIDVSSQPDIMLSRVLEEGVKLTKVITTHKHWDHAGGNDVIAEKYPSIEIIGGEIDNCEAVTKNVNENDEFNLGSLKIKCIHTPGHTMGSICYYVDDNGDKAVFTGDFLFKGGVGKFFEGTASDVYPGLMKLASLPEDTKIYCGHEYTLSNYRFLESIDNTNIKLIEAYEIDKKKREAGEFTIPSTIGLELQTNAFMRVNDINIINALRCTVDTDPIEVLAKCRLAKNNFK